MEDSDSCDSHTHTHTAAAIHHSPYRRSARLSLPLQDAVKTNTCAFLTPVACVTLFSVTLLRAFPLVRSLFFFPPFIYHFSHVFHPTMFTIISHLTTCEDDAVTVLLSFVLPANFRCVACARPDGVRPRRLNFAASALHDVTPCHPSPTCCSPSDSAATLVMLMMMAAVLNNNDSLYTIIIIYMAKGEIYINISCALAAPE